MQKYQKTIFWFFSILIFLVPLILWPYTSEVFEFNKMVLVYILTTLITAVWIVRMIAERKIIFRRTILDIPLLAFTASQIISTILSIDPQTSVFGYYSRFNGGLLSVFCYNLLYWAFVSNIAKKEARKLIHIFLGSATIVSIYAVLEHFGIDKNIWVQDVASRVFSTLGQPNWLAAWIVALSPITWALMLNTDKKLKSVKFWIYSALSILFFWTLIFTKSRSGYLGFAAAGFIFWILAFWKYNFKIKKILWPLFIVGISSALICLISGTEYTPSITQILHHQLPSDLTQVSVGTTSLETGGTESGTIRKIVWKGAIQVFLHYPIFGTGVETFAYSYYLYRPAEHNLTSEWDFLYNKAHNEYLNFAANSGTVGILTYLIVIVFSILLMLKSNKLQEPNHKQATNYNLGNWDLLGTWNLKFALLAGYFSLLVTNFFGFSVVPTQIELFLFPAFAIAVSLNDEIKTDEKKTKLNYFQTVSIAILLPFIFYLLFLICRYWYADTLYSSAKNYNAAGRPDTAALYLSQAINLEPNQPIYRNEISTSYANLAVYYYNQKDTEDATKLANLAVSESDSAINSSPANVNFPRTRFGVFITLTAINPNYLLDARDTLIAAIARAPTNAKLYYYLALVYARTGQSDLALSTLQKTIKLKANYEEARYAYALLLINDKKNQEAKTQLEYILKYINPESSTAKEALAGIK